jgi:CHAD domain-containing protein
VLEIYEPCFPRKAWRDVLDDVKALADALGERRDPDVHLAQLEEFAAAVKDADRPGVEVFAERVRSEQGAGNEALAAALATIEQTDLRGRLAALCAAASPADDPRKSFGLQRPRPEVV